MNDPLVWSILLLLLGIGLIVLEFLIPSGGILGLMAGAALFCAIVVAFFDKRLLSGPSVLVAVAVGVPILIYAAVRWWPDSPMGRLMLIQHKYDHSADTDNHLDKLRALIGKRGKAKCPMMPSGAIEIEGQSYDAVSDGVSVEDEQAIRVVAVRNNRLVVRPDEGEPATPQPPQDDPNQGDPKNIPSQPLESLGLEDLDDPLG